MKFARAKIPASFKRLLWSYDFHALDSLRDKKTIILNVINYGKLSEWQWLGKHYGRSAVKKMLLKARQTEIRKGAKKLASLLFSSK